MANQYKFDQPITPAASRPVNGLWTGLRQLGCKLDSWQAGPWGWLPLLTLVMASGFLLVSVGFRASVSSGQAKDGFYWLGLLLLVVPTAARLATVSATRQERLALVLLLGMALYGVKVIHSPAAFTYADELVHYANTDKVLSTHQLYGENSILPVTPRFPGLAALTSGLASLSGLSIFASGLLVIGMARLIITLGLFLIYEKVSDSARLAGLAAVIYMANSNYLYWSAQFAYESLALPLAVLVVFVLFFLVLRLKPGSDSINRPGILAVLMGLLAVTVTHHLTSFALAGLLGLAALFYTVLSKENGEARRSLWALTFVTLGAVLFWNLRMAPDTDEYLGPVLMRAVNAGMSLLRGGWDESGRALFESNASVPTPIWEQVAAIASVLIIVAATPIGLWGFWRRLRWSALAWVLVLATLAYFPLQALRFTGAGWETANRASEFLFVGAAFVIGLALSTIRTEGGWLPVAAVVGIVTGILFVGGVISGWPPALRIARPYQVAAKGPGGKQESIEPQGVVAAEWAQSHLKPGSRMAADNSSARLMQAYGKHYALAGPKYGIRDLFVNQTINRGELEIIQVTKIEYLVFARPLTRWDQMLGLYYNPAEGRAVSETELLKRGYRDKFDQNPGVDRLLDTGNLVIYDIGGLLDAATKP